jgi:hypothetical protein
MIDLTLLAKLEEQAKVGLNRSTAKELVEHTVYVSATGQQPEETRYIEIAELEKPWVWHKFFV